MTRFDYWKCDLCGKLLENAECSPKQIMFTLVANYDCNNKYAHFCSLECLKKYVNKKVVEHDDLPQIKIEDS